MLDIDLLVAESAGQSLSSEERLLGCFSEAIDVHGFSSGRRRDAGVSTVPMRSTLQVLCPGPEAPVFLLSLDGMRGGKVVRKKPNLSPIPTERRKDQAKPLPQL